MKMPIQTKLSCLIIDTMHESIISMLEEIGFSVTYEPTLSPAEIINKIHLYNGLILRSKMTIDISFLKKASQLRFIARAGAGLELIDQEEAKKKNIILINAPEANRDAVAEHTIGLLLSLLNKIPTANEQIKSKKWDREYFRGVELKGKTVGIIGYGFMGQAFAKRLNCFGCNVIAYDKYKTSFSDEYVKEVNQNEIFAQSDIVSLHIPLTTENKYSIDENYINSFHKSFYFLNTARGELIKMSVLQNALENGKIKGAALDVLENEKLNTLSVEQEKAFQYLSQSEKVILTPHVAGWSYESYERINEVLIDKIKMILDINR